MHILKSFSRSVEPACWKPTPVAATFRMKLQDCYLPNSDNSCKHLKIYSTITLRLYSIRSVNIRSASVKVKARLNGVSMDERQTFGEFVILLPRTSLYFELCWTTGVMVNFPLKERPSTFLSCSEPHTSSTRRWGGGAARQGMSRATIPLKPTLSLRATAIRVSPAHSPFTAWLCPFAPPGLHHVTRERVIIFRHRGGRHERNRSAIVWIKTGRAVNNKLRVPFSDRGQHRNLARWLAPLLPSRQWSCVACSAACGNSVQSSPHTHTFRNSTGLSVSPERELHRFEVLW